MECPICKLKYQPRDIQTHVNECLDRKETRKQVKEDEKLAQQLSRQLSMSTPDQKRYPEQIQKSAPPQTNPQTYVSPNASPQMYYAPVNPQMYQSPPPNYFYAPAPYPYQHYSPQYNARPQTPNAYPQVFPQQPYSPIPGYASAYAVPNPYPSHPYPSNGPVYATGSPLPPHYQHQQPIQNTPPPVTNVQIETKQQESRPRRGSKPIPDTKPSPISPLKSATMTPELQEERLKSMDQTWLTQLKQDPHNEAIIKALITGHLNVILTTENHRFGKLLPRFVASWNKKYKKNILIPKRRSLTESQFQTAIEEVKGFVENLISVLDNFYGGLCSLNDNIRAYCESAIGDLLFPTIYKDLFEIFKQKCKDEDAQYAKKRKDLLTINLPHLGVPKMYWLLSEESFDNPMPTDPPYHKAIVTLQQISNCETPAKKIEILIQTATAIVNCVHDHWRSQMDPSKIVIGGDELLPLFAYVVIRSGIPNLWSESSFIETFINEKTAIEKGGYLLATLQTCLNLVNTLDVAQMQTNAKEILDKAQREAETKALVKWDPNNNKVNSLETLEKMLEEEQDDFEELSTMNSSPSSVQYEPHRDAPHIDVDLIEL